MSRPFSPTLLRSSPKLHSSSKSWLSRQSRDPFVRKRTENPISYRARSAFKLLELDEKYHLFSRNDQSVVDLGAAPGSWSQVVAWRLGWLRDDLEKPVREREKRGDHVGKKRKGKGKAAYAESSREEPEEDDIEVDIMNELFGLDNQSMAHSPSSELGLNERGRGTIIAVDLLPIVPIPGVQTLQMDFLSPEAESRINALLPPSPRGAGGNVDVLLSDMAANFTGNRIRDVEASLDICNAVFSFAEKHLRVTNDRTKAAGGALVLKHFAHPLADRFRIEKLEPNFRRVHFIKPDSSRSESSEGYWLCMGWTPVAPQS
ncbi:23S ribosomal RNA methyltransferase [Panus rudis PR-1116 ss-1]|nr:23S ribosomal RNA methyltransferase [Panus rudis PR-1116 ss-1]